MPLSRRCFLQGLSAAVALPLLDTRKASCAVAAPASDAAFASQLADFVERWHLQSDQSPQRGTLHEFVVTTRLHWQQLPATKPGQWGQWVQCVGGDTLHAAAWCALGMIHAWRATGEKRYRKLVLEYTLPWFLKMLLDSDTLFPDQSNTVRAGVKLKIDGAMKGYLPFWWDDGEVLLIEPKTVGIMNFFGKVEHTPTPDRGEDWRFYGYTRMVSQHMAQIVCCLLAEAWWLTKDPRIGEAAKVYADFYARATPWKLPVLNALRALTSRDPSFTQGILARQPSSAARGTVGFRNLYGYYEKLGDKELETPGFLDNEFIDYYTDLMKSDGRLTEGNAVGLIAAAYHYPRLIRFWSDTAPMPEGINRYDRALSVIPWRHGAPVRHRSQHEIAFGARVGPQHLVIVALALQALRAHPAAWTKIKETAFGDDWLVPMHPLVVADRIPATQAWSAPWIAGPGKLEMASTLQYLEVRGKCSQSEFALTIHGRPDSGNPFATITATQAGGFTAVNHNGQPVKVDGTVEKKGDGFVFALRVPYSAVIGQNEWANGIDHGRYLVEFAGARRVAYLLTDSAELKAHLEAFLSRGLANWEAVWQEHGFIPISLNRPVPWGNAGDGRAISHLYGYAFLISAAAQSKVYRDGRDYWTTLAG